MPYREVEIPDSRTMWSGAASYKSAYSAHSTRSSAKRMGTAGVFKSSVHLGSGKSGSAVLAVRGIALMADRETVGTNGSG